MAIVNKTEVWLRGPVPGILPVLQPVAHALLQAREEVNALMENFPPQLLWQKPAGLATAGFHLQHMKGVVDRLFTYARGEMLSPDQLNYLSAEGRDAGQAVDFLVRAFDEQITLAIAQLSQTAAADLFATRAVGRQQVPSTVIGLLVHAAEHTMRHLGQLLVTVKILTTNTR